MHKITSVEALEQLTVRHVDRLQRWRTSEKHAYFFLDSVDESRLTSTSALAAALRVVVNRLLELHSARASVFISSRQPDLVLTVDRTLHRPAR